MVGDPVVAVIAETPQQALDAAELVEVDYEPLIAVGDPEEAIESPPSIPTWRATSPMSERVETRRRSNRSPPPQSSKGPSTTPEWYPNPLETRSVLAEWRDGALTVHLSSQAPHLMAEEFAKAFGMAQSSVRVVTPFVGGSFGCKFDLAQEEMLAVIAAGGAGARCAGWSRAATTSP